MGNPICFGGAVLSTLLFLNSLRGNERGYTIIHAIFTAFQWGIFYSTLK